MTNARGSGRGLVRQLPAEARLEQRVEERTRELTALLEVARSLTSTLALEPLLDLILDQLLRVIDYRGASIIVARDDVLETIASCSTREMAKARSQVGYTVPLTRALPIWQAVTRGEPVVIGDVRGDDPFARTWREAGSDTSGSPVRAWLGVPLSVRGQVVGFLALTRDVPDSFTGRDTELAVAFAGHAATAIDNARLLDESERRARELATLLEVSRAVASTLELTPLLDLILEQLLRVIDYRGAAIIVARDEALEVLAMRDTRDRSRERGQVGQRVPPAQVTAIWQTVLRGEPVLIGDVRRDDPFARAWRTAIGSQLPDPLSSPVRAWMGVPLSVRGQVFGLLGLTREVPDSFTARDTELAVAFAGHAATAIENAGLHDESERRARELATLLEVSHSVASTLELKPLLGMILDQLRVVADYTGSTVAVVEGEDLICLDDRGGSAPNQENPELTGARLPLARLGRLWEVISRREPVIIADAWGDNPLACNYREVNADVAKSSVFRHVRSLLSVPLVVRDRVIGYVSISHTEPDHFTHHHARLAMGIATQAAAAIEHARLFEQERRASRELASLLEVSQTLASTLELRPLMGLILDQIKVIVDYAGCAVHLCEGDHLTLFAARRPPDQGQPDNGVGSRIPLSRGKDLWDVLNNRRPAIIADVRDDSVLARSYRAAVGEQIDTYLTYVRAWMGVPLALKDQVIGIISLTSNEPDYFTPRHARLVTAIANQAAAAIENARLYEQELRTARELSSLLEVSHTLASTLELRPLLGLILDQLKAVAHYTGASILTIDGDEMTFLGARGTAGQEDAVGLRIPLDRASPIWQMLSRREPVIIADIRDETLLSREYRAAIGERLETPPFRHIRSWLAVPLALKDRVIGMVTVSWPEPDYYTPRHARLVMAIANQAAAAIENARLYAQTEQRARELATLLDVSRAVASTLELTPLLDLILEQLKTVVDYRGATLGTIAGEDLFIAASRAATPEREADRGMRFPLRRFGPIWEAIARGEPAIIADVRGDAPAAVEYRALNAALMDGPTHRDIRSWMAVPLALGDRVIGMLSASQDTPNYFTPHHADLALAFANQAAVAVENARLFAETQGKAALEERQRLARELHDSVSQALFGIALGAGAARRRLERDPARVGESLDYVLSLADAALTEMRALIFELRPEALEKDGLVAALMRHAAATRARHEIAVETTLCAEPDVPLPLKEALYRIAQEAMHNAVKHARASRIELVLGCSPAGLTLEVRDDGVGFDPSRDFAGHLGLHSMRERMAAIGGTADIASTPGAGTRIRVAARCG